MDKMNLQLKEKKSINNWTDGPFTKQCLLTANNVLSFTFERGNKVNPILAHFGKLNVKKHSVFLKMYRVFRESFRRSKLSRS